MTIYGDVLYNEIWKLMALERCIHYFLIDVTKYFTKTTSRRFLSLSLAIWSIMAMKLWHW